MILAPSELSITEYHAANPTWCSKTSLRDYLTKGPKWWNRNYIKKEAIKENPGGVTQGLALDVWLTEGQESFDNQFSIKPAGIDGRTKEGKAWAAEQRGRIIINQDDYQILLEALDEVRLHPRWSEVEKCQPQMTCRRKPDGLCLGLQARPDYLSEDRRIIFDLKKTCDLDAFPRQAINLGYHLQGAVGSWCLAGDKFAVEEVTLIAVEWDVCPRVRFYTIPQEALVHGDMMMRQAAAEIDKRIKSGYWSDVQTEREMLPIPDWMLRKMEAGTL